MTPNPSSNPLQQARRESWGQVNRQRLAFVKAHAAAPVLDVGCATGGYINYLNEHGLPSVGVDLLPYPEWQAASTRPFAQASALNLPFANGAFQTVLAFEVLEHIPSPAQALQEIGRVCHGTLILSVPDASLPADLLRGGLVYAHWLDRTHTNFFEEGPLRDMLESQGWQVSVLTRINPILPDYLPLRSLHIPDAMAFPAARLFARLPFRKKYPMTLLAVAQKRAAQEGKR